MKNSALKMKNTSPLIILADLFQINKEILLKKSEKEQFEALAQYIEELINKDFNRLLSILYRIDVAEEKVRAALAENPNSIPAGHIIAKLLIEREKEKMALREKYSRPQ